MSPRPSARCEPFWADAGHHPFWPFATQGHRITIRAQLASGHQTLLDRMLCGGAHHGRHRLLPSPPVTTGRAARAIPGAPRAACSYTTPWGTPPFADLQPSGHDPWAVLARMGRGFLAPDFGAVDQIGRALMLTVACALTGVALGGAAGLLMAPFYRLWPVRTLCIALRSVHELFWALMLMQMAGIGVFTGVAAIALPYAAIFAKVFAEYLEEADQRPTQVLPPGADALSRFLYARLPLAAVQMGDYALYRVECGLRSSAVLGFIGLPTLGFQLDNFFLQGEYGAVSAIMILYVAMIASMRLWLRWRLAALWVLAAAVALSTVHSPPMGEGALWRFIGHDIVPAPLRNGADWAGFAA